MSGRIGNRGAAVCGVIVILIAFALTATLLSAPTAGPERASAAQAEIAGKLSTRARVVSVTDGDTVRVRIKRRERSVRLIGIDTPEVYFGRECGGRRASRSMKRLLPVGSRIRLIRDRSQDGKDRYGRLLRYIVRQKRDVGRIQVRRGWARVYVYGSPFKRIRSYRRAQRQASATRRGVWGMCGGNFDQPA